MNQTEFEEQFPNFYADFGYAGSVKLPPSVSPEHILSGLLGGTQSANAALAISQEYVEPNRYFVQLSWRSIVIDCFPCSKQEYDQQTIPTTVIEAAQAFEVDQMNQ